MEEGASGWTTNVLVLAQNNVVNVKVMGDENQETEMIVRPHEARPSCLCSSRTVGLSRK